MINSAAKYTGSRFIWTLYGLAALSFAITLGLPYIGEEGVYTNTAIEMSLRENFFVNTLYGTNYGRPPLLNWLIIALSELLGWERMLVASRLITAVATIATGLVLAWLVAVLTRDRRFAAFAALVYLTGDALMYHGWLAYADPLFAFFIFSAIACLWVAIVRRTTALLWIAMAAISCAALTKAPTAYVFYLGALFVFCWQREVRAFLLRPGAIIPHVAIVVLFVAWHRWLTGGVQMRTELDIVLAKLGETDVGAYLNQLWQFPLETALRFLPASGLAVWFWLRRNGAPLQATGFPFAVCAWIALLNYLPYWLGPGTAARYVMPLYPLCAALIADWLWQQPEARRRLVIFWLIATIAFKYVLGLWAFPVYQHSFRGDYSAVAADIGSLTRGFPLYATDVSATGLSVAAHINTRRYPAKPLQWPPAKWDSGFVIAYTQDPALGQVFKKYRLGGDDLYLLCRGAACGEKRDQ
jgi:4-amino-4-deoxy-L-arabinose transferase-like glycosyltransferase